MRHLNILHRFAAVAIWGTALCVFALGEAAAESASELASGKKGREPCESDDECETKVCKDGACDPCPTRENCPPPGRCTKKDHKDFDAIKGKACSEKRTCQDVKNVAPTAPGDTDCRLLTAREAQGRLCVTARWNIMEKCFDEGNAAHVGEHKRDEEVRQFCQDAIEQRMASNRCYDCDNFDSLNSAAESACKKPTECKQQKDEKKADCAQMARNVDSAGECTQALDALAE